MLSCPLLENHGLSDVTLTNISSTSYSFCALISGHTPPEHLFKHINWANVRKKKSTLSQCLNHMLQRYEINKQNDSLSPSHTCFNIPKEPQPGAALFFSSPTLPAITLPPATTTQGTRNLFPFHMSARYLSYPFHNLGVHCIKSRLQN